MESFVVVAMKEKYCKLIERKVVSGHVKIVESSKWHFCLMAKKGMVCLLHAVDDCESGQNYIFKDVG